MTKLLFVCLGNICRSPAADGVMLHMIREQQLEPQLLCDSAGTSAYHAGEPADGRMRETAAQRGYDLTSISRQFILEDFKNFDFILTMDGSNYSDVVAMDARREYTHKVHPFTNFCQQHDINHVPDPYYGGGTGFDLVMDIVEDGCQGFLEHLRKEGLVK